MTDFANAIPTAVDIVRREKCYEGFYKLDRVHLRHELFAGGMSREINREVFVRHDAVCVLPYDPQRDEVVLIEQFRVGAMGKTDNPWLVELVAGLIDKDEQPEEVAHREAQEEAGLVFGALWPMTKYFPSPGGSNEFVHLYLGRCETTGVGGWSMGLVDVGRVNASVLLKYSERAVLDPYAVSGKVSMALLEDLMATANIVGHT